MAKTRTPPVDIMDYLTEIGCGLLEARVDYRRATVTVIVPPMHCTSMTRVIKFSQRLLPSVREVFVVGAGCLVSHHEREPDGQWISHTIGYDWRGAQCAAAERRLRGAMGLPVDFDPTPG